MESGECHAAAAGRLMGSITKGKKVRLSSTVLATNGGRPVRFVDVVSGSTYIDPQLRVLEAGLALALNLNGERARGYEYHLAMEKAAARHVNLWNPAACGSGPQQGISTPRMLVKYDLDMDDFAGKGLSSENVQIFNTSSTTTLNLGGWYVRDASHYRPYVFPKGTTVKPKGSITLYTGAGHRTTTRFFWNRNLGAFTNPKSRTDDNFGGLYLFDPSHDIRSHITWPCVYGCAPAPALKISRVVYNPVGDDYTHVNREYIGIRTRGSTSVNLTGVVVTLGGHVFHFGANQWLKPNETLQLRSGRGANTHLVKHWGYGHPLLGNSGTVRLSTSEAVPITCSAWGSSHC